MIPRALSPVAGERVLEKNMDQERCEMCDKPATVRVADFRRLPPVVKNGKRFSHAELESRHVFCDEHKRPSRTLDAAGPPAPADLAGVK